MNQETRICQNCKKEFAIEPEDFEFYKKIKVPPPTWCPECRLIRRMVFCNLRTLYKRKCDLCKNNIISIYPKDTPFPVYCSKCWWSDDWNPMDYGKDYDFSKPFLKQFKEIIQKVPVPALKIDWKAINSEYTNFVGGIKSCYLVFGAGGGTEDCYYSYNIIGVKDCIDATNVIQSELCYDSFDLIKCYRAHFSQNCDHCNDIYFSKQLTNCSNCFGCVDLRHKQYYIFNKPYFKKEYEEKLREFNLGSYRNIKEIIEKSKKFHLKFPNKFMHGRRNNNVSGNFISYSKNVINSYEIVDTEDCKNCYCVTRNVKSCYDYAQWGNNAELIYESTNCGKGIYKIKFSVFCQENCKDLEYSWQCVSSSNLFGCIGLRHKQYCILNKQYTKEEYEKLVPKIIDHMNKMPYIDKKGRVYKYGEFFPPELSPFAYNETVAQEYFPLTKEQALKQDYSWKDPEERNIKPDIKTEDLPDHIKDVKDDIVGKIIQCSHAKFKEDGTLEATCNEQCTTAFKIIEPELQFYKRMNLPLPRLCPNCRHYQRIKQRNPLKLWKRKCMCGGRASVNGVYQNTIEHFHGKELCPNEFETTYAPDRSEIVYCESCYLQEVV